MQSQSPQGYDYARWIVGFIVWSRFGEHRAHHTFTERPTALNASRSSQAENKAKDDNKR